MKEAAAVAEGGANVGQERIGSTGGHGFRKDDDHDNDNEVAVSCNLQYFLNIYIYTINRLLTRFYLSFHTRNGHRDQLSTLHH